MCIEQDAVCACFFLALCCFVVNQVSLALVVVIRFQDVSKSLILHGQNLSVIFFVEIESVINRQNIDKCVFESNLRLHKDWFQEKQGLQRITKYN